MARGRVVIIGAGIIGIAHALEALAAGWAVMVLEREGRPLGASVRNFGTLWPIGCAQGPEREQALYGVRRWKELADEAGFWLQPGGSLSLAHREEAWAVLQEFSQGGRDEDAFRLLSRAEVDREFPAANPAGLRGALHSVAETTVHPPSALAALVALAQQRGATVEFGQPVIKVLDDAVELANGRRLNFTHLVIAAGDEMRLLFPAEIAAAQVTRCRLQMMRTVPQPGNFELGSIFVSDLTLCHYPAFRNCPSVDRLRARLEAELPRHREHGVHVIVAQHPDGSLVLGDSHEYGGDFDPDSRADVDELIIEEAARFVRIPELKIASRWQGIYLRSTIGQTQVVLRPRPGVTMVTAMGGLGMTLSWGLAKRTVESWESAETE